MPKIRPQMEYAKNGITYTLGKNKTSCKTPKIHTRSQELMFVRQ